jgi:hypothetical protein
MNGRRRDTRFLPSTPWNATFQTTEDVVLERIENGDIWVLCDSPARRGDHLTLEIATGGLQIDVQVLASEPFFADDGIRHRLRLELLSSDPGELVELVACVG